MKLQRPRGFPSATWPEAPELRKNIPYWSYSPKARRRLQNVESALVTALRRLQRKLLVDGL